VRDYLEKVLATYRLFLKDERKNLLNEQFDNFADSHNLPKTVKLRNSYLKLMDVLDDDKPTSKNWAETIYANNFLFELLSAIPDAKERELRRTTQAFCNLLDSAGLGNKRCHRLMRNRYAQAVSGALSEVMIDPSLRKTPEFKGIWTTDLKERLNTKRDY
tara:strand:+ start:2308 stop:2787 length:480 start_codon:yes stop_codon:yes gene_type:complete